MLINGIDYKIASSKDEMKNAYELVYKNYIEKKFCNLNYHKMRIFLFDSLLATRTFIAKKGEEVLATATLVFDSPIGLPSDGIYKDRLDVMRREGKKICEISKLSTKRELGSDALRILPYLFRSCWLYAKEINKHSHFCILIEPQNEIFYLKTFFFEKNTDIRLDPKAEDAESIFLEMPLDLNEKAAKNLDNPRAKKRYQMHFEDPDITNILDEFTNAENEISRINISLLEPRQRRTLALTSEEKKCLEFKFFIIGYNLEQINKNAQSQTYQGANHEATESYENLMKTLPTWAFSKEKDIIYEKLCDLFFTMGSYNKVMEVATKLKNSTNNNMSVQGRNLYALGQYAAGNFELAIKNLKEAEFLSRESNDNIRLTTNLHIQGMIFNFQGKYEEALDKVSEAIIRGEECVPFKRKTYLYLTAFFINSHLGKIKACEKIVKVFQKEIPAPEKEDHFKSLLTYYNCMARFYMLILQNQKAKIFVEKILNKIISKDEMPFNYAVYLTNYAAVLIALGETRKALEVNAEILLLKMNYPLKSYVGYLAQKYLFLLFINNLDAITECKNEINAAIKQIGDKKFNLIEYKNAILVEHFLKREFKKSLSILKELAPIEKWNKPQLNGDLDMTTIHLLMNNPKKARQCLAAENSAKENELVDTALDNKLLIDIYFKLIDNSIENIAEDIDFLFKNKIDKDEVMAKALILFYIIQILDVQNKKKPKNIFAETRKKLMSYLAIIIAGKEIPLFEKFIKNNN